MEEIKSLKISDRAGKTIECKEVGGRIYPPFPEESLRNGFTFKARPDDVLLCAYPKSGTHWTFQIIRFLLAGTTNLPHERKRVGMIENEAPSLLEALPSPRNLNTHYHFNKMSPDFLRQKCKIIHVVRDPRDVLVSLLNHTKSFDYEGEWKDFFPLVMEDRVDFCRCLEYTKEFENGMKDNPDHSFLVLVYEAMLEDPLRAVTKIAEFLGVTHSENFLKEVVQKTSFTAMKKASGPDDNINFGKANLAIGKIGSPWHSRNISTKYLKMRCRERKYTSFTLTRFKAKQITPQMVKTSHGLEDSSKCHWLQWNTLRTVFAPSNVCL